VQHIAGRREDFARPGSASGLKIGLLVGGLPPLFGRVRWMKDDAAGMSFYGTVPLDVLAPWSAALGRPGQPGRQGDTL